MEELLWDSSDEEEDKRPPRTDKATINGNTKLKVSDAQRKVIACQF